MAESLRLRLLGGLDELLQATGLSLLAGVDEAGRGCLAGPVVAAAVIADPERTIPGVDDSKVVPAERREHLAELIRRQAVAWAVVPASAATIDRVNVLEATRSAMAEALVRLRPRPECAVVDAVPLAGLPFRCLPVVRGDAISYSVACASILAKVERDRMMRELDAEYPQYGFRRHKGYAAEEHRQALVEFGPCPAHRLTFRSVVPRAAEATH